MKTIFKHIYLLITPEGIRKKRNLLIAEGQLKNLKKRIIKYYAKLPKTKTTQEQKVVIKYLKKNPISVYPYNYKKKYITNDIEVFKDNANSLLFTILNGKKLYFKRTWSIETIKNYANDLLIEQDINSPHRYLTDDFQINNNDIVVDVGVAEGNFSLSIIEKASKLYLFETDKEWTEALSATFSPWKEKVIIINKYVSNINNDKKITLDNFFMGNSNIDFLKVDVDGAESELIQGSENLFLSSKIYKVALCTYHKQEDENIFTKFLHNKGFNVTYSIGYMIFYHDKSLSAPYLRRGLIRATNTSYSDLKFS